jgi:hypothetical protein
MSFLSGYLFIVLILNALLLGLYTVRRSRDFWSDTTNRVGFHVVAGTGTTCLAVVCLALPGVFPHNADTAALLTSAGIVLDLLGFTYFLRIPLGAVLRPRAYEITSHLAALAVVGTAAALIVIPPTPRAMIGSTPLYGAVTPIAFFVVFVMSIAFVLNIALFYRIMRRNGRGWVMKSAALIATLAFTGIGSGYLFVGRNPILLASAATLVCAGLFAFVIGSFSRSPLMRPTDVPTPD